MKHYGDITKINGALVEPVNVVIGGSPCQDLSVAGKQAGLAGERSGLFMEQLRVIKEMRRADLERGRTGKDTRPRYMVWENVPGVYSSGAAPGADFREVIEAFIRIEEPYLDVVRPASGRWEYAGAVLGVRSCVAWATWSAEYFGVPQRRRRCFAVTDLAGYSPIQILFEQDCLPGYPAARERAGQAAASRAGAGIEAPGGDHPPIP